MALRERLGITVSGPAGRRRRRGALVLLTWLLVWAIGTGAARAGQEAATAPAAPAAPAATVAPTPTPDLKELEISILKARLARAEEARRGDHIGRLVYETQLGVAALRGFPVRGLVQYAPLDDGVLTKIFNTSVEKQFPDKSLEQWTWLSALFGELPEGYDLKAEMRKLIGEQVAGLYDPDSKRLYVSQTFALDSAMGRTILAHEITHAMQDQNFDLRRMGIEAEENDDLATAISCIAEGDATLAMGEYLVTQGRLFNLLLDLPKMLLMDQKEFEQSPKAIQQSMIFPYVQGMTFFQELGGRTRQRPGGNRAAGLSTWRSDVFAQPPISTSQILHPRQYLLNKRPARIPPFEVEDSKLASTNVVGEFGIRGLLDAALEPALDSGATRRGQAANKLDLSSMLAGEDALNVSPRAAAAAEGWNGDRILIEDDATGEHRTLRWVTRWDTARDAAEFRAALRDALQARLGDGVKWGEKENGEDSSRPTITAEGAKARLTIDSPEETSVRMEGTFALTPAAR